MADPSDDFREPHLRRGDFLGAFAVVERDRRILMVQNERVVAGAAVHTWDLPGGQLEPGELVHEALHRELREETGLGALGEPRFLFVQEGVRRRGAHRLHAWRSFFFAVLAEGDPQPGGEVLAVRWFSRDELPGVLHAPYHDSFLRWLERGGTWFGSEWVE